MEIRSGELETAGGEFESLVGDFEPRGGEFGIAVGDFEVGGGELEPRGGEFGVAVGDFDTTDGALETVVDECETSGGSAANLLKNQKRRGLGSEVAPRSGPERVADVKRRAQSDNEDAHWQMRQKHAFGQGRASSTRGPR